MYTGPHLIKDNLVFGYDTGYGVADNNTQTRHYKGNPGTNLWDSILNTQSLRTHTKHYWDGSKWAEDSTYTHPGVSGPIGTYLGIVLKHITGALSSSWSGNSYGYMLRDISCTNGATMVMSSWVYASSDCNLNSIPAVIEGESGGESTVTGFPASYDLNNKDTWQVIAKKATSDGNTRFIPLYPRKSGVTNGTFTGFFMWALPQVTYGSYVTPPLQPGSTRSSTQSLIDLKRTTDIDVSNISFDSTGQPDFDGSDDHGIITNFPHIWNGSVSVEAVAMWHDDTRSVIFGNFDQGSGGHDINIEKLSSGRLRFYWDRGARDVTSSNNVVTTNGSSYHHCVFVRDSTNNNFKFYVDGELVTTVSNAGPGITSTGSTFRFGSDTRTGSTVHNGAIPVLKLHNKALTTAEIKQNFRAYKNRFNL